MTGTVQSRNRSCLYWLRQDPSFDSIRSDALLREVDFCQEFLETYARRAEWIAAWKAVP